MNPGNPSHITSMEEVQNSPAMPPVTILTVLCIKMFTHICYCQTVFPTYHSLLPCGDRPAADTSAPAGWGSDVEGSLPQTPGRNNHLLLLYKGQHTSARLFSAGPEAYHIVATLHHQHIVT